MHPYSLLAHLNYYFIYSLKKNSERWQDVFSTKFLNNTGSSENFLLKKIKLPLAIRTLVELYISRPLEE
jgi:hypothetical protein